jgi:hypothetical protein
VGKIRQRVSEEDATHQAVTVAHIEELREEIRRLAQAQAEPAYGESLTGTSER